MKIISRAEIERWNRTYHRLLYNVCISRPPCDGVQLNNLLLRLDHPVRQNPLPCLIGRGAGQPMTPSWHQHTRTRNPFHQGSRIRMLNEFGIDGLCDSGYEVSEGYLVVKNHGEFLFQSFCCLVMVESVDLRLLWGLRWREQHRSGPVDNYIHDASQLGCIRQRQEHGVQSQTRSRLTRKIGG